MQISLGCLFIHFINFVSFDFDGILKKRERPRMYPNEGANALIVLR